jgi:hypothetical protein
MNDSAGVNDGPASVPAPPGRTPGDDDFVTKMPLAWTPGVALRDGRVSIGGSPWTVTVLPDDVVPLAQKLHALGRVGALVKTAEEKKAAVFHH